MVLVFGALRSLWQNERSVLRKLFPGLLLTVYGFAGGALFFFVEKGGPCPMASYWAAVQYAGTIYTTIGYGVISPCTAAGRAFTVIYAIIGIPITLMTLKNVGQMFAFQVSRGWAAVVRFSCCRNRLRRFNDFSKIRPVVADKTDPLRGPTDQRMSITISLVLTILWIMICALFFALTEDWNFFSALYFVMISVTTIGFGDFSPERYSIAVAQLAMLIIGLALFSMCINVVQYNLEHMVTRITDVIMQNYIASLQESHDSPIFFTNEETARTVIHDIIRKQPAGRFLNWFMSKKDEDMLVREYLTKSQMRHKAIQNAPQMIDAVINHSPISSDVSVQVGRFARNAVGGGRVVTVKDQGQQLTWMPRVRLQGNWSELMALKSRKRLYEKKRRVKIRSVAPSVHDEAPSQSTHRKATGTFKGRRTVDSGSPKTAASASSTIQEFLEDVEIDSDVQSDFGPKSV